MNEKEQIESIRARVNKKAQEQSNWKHEAIEKAIDILIGTTHREKDIAIKVLLSHLKKMPSIQEWDLDLPSNELPF